MMLKLKSRDYKSYLFPNSHHQAHHFNAQGGGITCVTTTMGEDIVLQEKLFHQFA